MKYYLKLALLFFLPAIAFAQPSQVFNLNRLTKNDTLLSGWKFHAGDNLGWRKPAINDNKWQTVNPSVDVSGFKPLKDAGTGWLRLHIKVDSALGGHVLALRISQVTASEVYLNGQLIGRYGYVSSDGKSTVGYVTSKKPFIIKLIPGHENVIAVRLGYQRGLPYISSLFEPLYAFAAYINDYPSAVANYNAYEENLKGFVLIFSLFGGAVLIVFFTHIVYFLFDRRNKLNLYYALFCLLICYITLPNELFGMNRFGELASQMWVEYAEGSGFVIGMLFLLLTVYAMCGYPHRKIFTGLAFIGGGAIIYMFFGGTTGFFISTSLIPILFMFEAVHVCIWAIKQQRKDARYTLLGVVSFVTLVAISAQLDQSTFMAQLLWGAGVVCFPLGMSFYLGIQGSITNKKMTHMLGEVQTLSARSLSQEIEKQQILATQNETLEYQVAERTAELNQSLVELKLAQTQLIQSEKMASLGELTAGIAHEIQNPLNFVNNFSEVSVELLQELKEEAEAGHTEDVLAIADDLTQNLQKINQHGKRADNIVKGMLQHSRTSTGEKQPTNINLLADEFLKLSYHGLRAKDKNFNAELVTNFDENLPKVNIVQQDMGRVLLNLFNNAFYAVNQKKKTAGTDYKPTVEVTTFAPPSGGCGVKVKDNGIGMPDAIKDKIMQPFFTTKPTGEGTGLGLSLSYDIVVKGHGGKIEVFSEEGVYTEFVISLFV
ncbi:MAG: ATP-binding protein [Bacteroidota bacterium]